MEKIGIEEVFDIAIEIERNGERFYKRFADAVADEKLRTVFRTLAEMEMEHANLFIQMKEKAISSSDAFYLDQEGLLNSYIKAFASEYVFNDDAESKLDSADAVGILKFAIDKEKDSVVYYLAVKDVVYGEENKMVVDNIISEEMKHIAELSELISIFSS